MMDTTEWRLSPTSAAKEIMTFMKLSESDLLEMIGKTGLLADTSTFSARRLQIGSIACTAFKNGMPNIRLFIDPEWLTDLEFYEAGDEISWTA